MKPILFVAFQVLALLVVFRQVWRQPSGLYRLLFLAAIAGVIGGLDVWYLGYHAYPTGFNTDW